MQNFLKVFGLIIALAGLVLGVLNLCGLFAHSDRKLMLALICEKGRAPSDTPAFREFLKKFPPPSGWSQAEITGLAPLSFIKSGSTVTPIGPLIYAGEGKQTKRIATFQELVDWSHQSSYPWISWVVTAVGWVICALGVVLEMHAKKKQRCQVLAKSSDATSKPAPSTGSEAAQG